MHNYLSQLVGTAGFGNIQMMKSRFETLWGSSHLLLMQLAAFREAASYWPHYDYVINLSESDFPIRLNNQPIRLSHHTQVYFEILNVYFILFRPLPELSSFLTANKGRVFVSGNQGMKQDDFVKKQGINHTFYQCDGHMFRLSARMLAKYFTFICFLNRVQTRVG